MDETNNIFVAFYEVFEGNVVVVVLCSFSSQIKRIYAFWKALIDSCVKWPKKWSSEQSIIVTRILEKLCGNAFDVIGHDISLNVLMINKRRKGEKRFAKRKKSPFFFFFFHDPNILSFYCTLHIKFVLFIRTKGKEK